MNTKIRVGGALLFGIALISGAVFLSRNSTDVPTQGGIVVLDTAPRTYQETKDSDGDGMRDWEEELKGTNPSVPNKILTPEEIATAGTSTDPSTPDTVTSRFAKTFFGQYLKGNAGDIDMSAAEKEQLIIQSVAEVTEDTQDPLFTQKDIILSNQNDTASVHQYGNTIGDALQKYPVPKENELVILKRALDTNDKSALKGLAPIVNSYKKTISDILATPAPSELASEHLNLLNALLVLHNTIIIMENAFVDPLPTLVRTQKYETHVRGLQAALQEMNITLRAQGVTYQDDEPGSFFEQQP